MKINDIKLINGNCLVEVEDRFNKKTVSGIVVGSTAYNKSDHAIRYGKLTRMPDSFNWDKEMWRTDYFPSVGDEVWFDYLDAKDTTAIYEDGKMYIVLKHKSLILARSTDGSIKVLNGYLLCKKQPLNNKSQFDFIDKHYSDVYIVIHAGKPNISYTPDKDKYGEVIREFVDDPCITEGMIVMTRANAYPVLEDSLHRKFVNEDLFYFQRRDVVGQVIEL